ncbi:MAG TPA: chemotaxis protein CheW [Novosphingobium sp.]|nr:chemotaxis protein CheW [Novosphingobium sp.]
MSELLLVLSIAGERLAFPAESVSSVIEVESLTPVPRVPDFVAGISALRSRPLTVLDGSAALGLGPRGGADCGRLGKAVVVEQDRHLYAILVDGIEDVVSATSEPAPPPAKLAPCWQRIALGLVETTAGTVLLADPALLIAGPEQSCAA